MHTPLKRSAKPPPLHHKKAEVVKAWDMCMLPPERIRPSNISACYPENPTCYKVSGLTCKDSFRALYLPAECHFSVFFSRMMTRKPAAQCSQTCSPGLRLIVQSRVCHTFSCRQRMIFRLWKKPSGASSTAACKFLLGKGGKACSWYPHSDGPRLNYGNYDSRIEDIAPECCATI